MKPIRQILHIDMDAFYAAIEELDNPALRGKPVIVGATPGKRGVVMTANYEARKFGVRSAMPSAQALRLCPQAVFIAGRMQRYSEISDQIHAIFQRYTPLVEPVSMDEAFLDVTGSRALLGDAQSIARAIKRELKQHIGLTASIGVASNKFVAKIASELQKPDGLVVVPAGTEREFLAPLPITRMWGVGKATAQILHRLGVYTIGDVDRVSPSILESHLHSYGPALLRLAHGIDERPVVPDSEAKSISAETTFEEDVSDPLELEHHLLWLAQRVAFRLLANKLKGNNLTLKVRFGDFKTITRSQSTKHPLFTTHDIHQAALTLLKTRVERKDPVRLLGVGVSGFSGSARQAQLTLFDQITTDKKHAKVDLAISHIQSKLGKKAIGRASITLTTQSGSKKQEKRRNSKQ